MTDKVQKIREEVKRLKEIAEYNLSHSKMDRSAWMQQASVCTNLLSFINSLQEEPVSEDLEKAALLYYPKMSRISEPHGIIHADNESHYLGDANEDNRKAFKVGANWQKQNDSIPISEDLEQAIDTYLATYFGGEKEQQEWPFLKKMAIHFAEWQKKQFEKDCSDLCNGIVTAKGLAVAMAYDKGVADGKEQLMAKAVKVNISNASIVSLPVNCDLKVGDKVLIIKED